MGTLVTAKEVLAAREARAARQTEWLAQNRMPLVCCTLNVAGAEKDSPLIRRCFARLILRLEASFGTLPVHRKEQRFLPTGPECFFAVSGDALEIKKRCVQTENACPAGRLLDADVLTENGAQVSRTSLGFPERGCIVCGKPGRSCAAGQLHSYEEIREKTADLMRAFLTESEPAYIAQKAVGALLREAHVTPKPGLVDEENSGSHKDMDLSLMEKSARSLLPYFETCVRAGMETAARAPAETFPLLRSAGIEAEKVMFNATHGVNTHKGAVYLFGILLGAYGRLWTPDALPTITALLQEAGRVAKNAVQEDFDRITASGTQQTTGERLYLQYGLVGVRGEAAAGFPSVMEALRPLTEKEITAEAFLENDNLLSVLLGFIAAGKDTNLIARGGMEKAKRAADTARALLASGQPDPAAIRALDRRFVSENLSPGGSADLLAVAIFAADTLREYEKL